MPTLRRCTGCRRPRGSSSREFPTAVAACRNSRTRVVPRFDSRSGGDVANRARHVRTRALLCQVVRTAARREQRLCPAVSRCRARQTGPYAPARRESILRRLPQADGSHRLRPGEVRCHRRLARQGDGRARRRGGSRRRTTTRSRSRRSARLPALPNSTFADARELGQVLASNRDLPGVRGEADVRYAFGRPETASDRPSVSRGEPRFGSRSSSSGSPDRARSFAAVPGRVLELSATKVERTGC